MRAGLEFFGRGLIFSAPRAFLGQKCAFLAKFGKVPSSRN